MTSTEATTPGSGPVDPTEVPRKRAEQEQEWESNLSEGASKIAEGIKTPGYKPAPPPSGGGGGGGGGAAAGGGGAAGTLGA